MKYLLIAITKAIAALIAISILVVLLMLAVSWSAEREANAICEKHHVGTLFVNTGEGSDRKPQRSIDGLIYYSYLKPMSFDSAAECKVYVDEQNRITKTEVVVY